VATGVKGEPPALNAAKPAMARRITADHPAIYRKR
jgi:hypothetical protein